MAIRNLYINGELQEIDYNGLANKPIIPDLTEVSNRISNLESNVSNILSSIDALEGSVSNMLSSIGNFENRIDALEGSVSGLDLPVVTSTDNGKVLGVDSNGNWVAMDINLSSVNQEIESIKQRLIALENNTSSTTQSSVSGRKLVTSGADVNVSGTKLTVNSESVSVRGNKLII